jgi:hypothetical protein
MSKKKEIRERSNTHRSAEGTAGNGQLDALVWLEAVDAARGKQIRRLLRTAQNLEQDGNCGWLKDDAINEESRAGIVLTFHVRFYTHLQPRLGLLTMMTFKSMLMSAPPGTGFPGCMTKGLDLEGKIKRTIGRNLTTGVGTRGWT